MSSRWSQTKEKNQTKHNLSGKKTDQQFFVDTRDERRGPLPLFVDCWGWVLLQQALLENRQGVEVDGGLVSDDDLRRFTIRFLFFVGIIAIFTAASVIVPLRSIANQ